MDRAIEALRPRSADAAISSGFSQGENKIVDDLTEPLPDPITEGTSFVRPMAAELAENRLFGGFSQEEWDGHFSLDCFAPQGFDFI